MDLAPDLLRLATHCALRTAGSMLDGIVHNLNNPAHALAMQAELLANHLKKDPVPPGLSTLQGKVERLRHVGMDIKEQIEVLSWRHAYTRTSMELLDPRHFGTWLLQFWRNNLFFQTQRHHGYGGRPCPSACSGCPLGSALVSGRAPFLHSRRAWRGPGFLGVRDTFRDSGTRPGGGCFQYFSISGLQQPGRFSSWPGARAKHSWLGSSFGLGLAVFQ